MGVHGFVYQYNSVNYINKFRQPSFAENYVKIFSSVYSMGKNVIALED